MGCDRATDIKKGGWSGGVTEMGRRGFGFGREGMSRIWEGGRVVEMRSRRFLAWPCARGCWFVRRFSDWARRYAADEEVVEPLFFHAVQF